MRPSLFSATPRDVTRAAQLCSRCRLEARLPASVAWTRSFHDQPGASSALQPAAHAPRQRRLFSQTTPSFADATTASTSNTTTETHETPKPRTFYDLFPETFPLGPPPAGRFPLDVRALRREFLRHQARTHPDLHPPAQKSRAETASALLNDAYRTLANPLLRAQYLLAQRGVDLAGDETAKVDEPGLLMAVLEAREEIEEAEAEADLEAPRAANDERIRVGELALEKAFRDDDLEAAKREAVRMRYWVNIKDSMDDWEPGKPVVLQH